MISAMLQLLFGCSHPRYSFPVTVRYPRRRPQAAVLTGTYVSCLECGKEMAYDWREMKVIKSARQERAYLRLQPGASA